MDYFKKCMEPFPTCYRSYQYLMDHSLIFYELFFLWIVVTLSMNRFPVLSVSFYKFIGNVSYFLLIIERNISAIPRAEACSWPGCPPPRAPTSEGRWQGLRLGKKPNDANVFLNVEYSLDIHYVQNLRLIICFLFLYAQKFRFLFSIYYDVTWEYIYSSIL